MLTFQRWRRITERREKKMFETLTSEEARALSDKMHRAYQICSNRNSLGKDGMAYDAMLTNFSIIRGELYSIIVRNVDWSKVG
jgi:hypothetical protein